MVNNFLFTLLTLMINSSYAQSKEVIALGDINNTASFNNFLKANPQFISHTDHKIKIEGLKNYKIVKSKYKLAFDGLLKKDLSFSILLFKEIVSLRKTKIFNNKAKSIISKSFLNLARLDKNSQKDWIKKAVEFDPYYSPDPELFNPEIINTFDRESLTLKPNLISKKSVKEKLSSNDQLFINGFSNNFVIKPNQKYYVTIYRKGQKPSRSIESFNTFQNIQKLELTNLQRGSCQKPRFSKSIRKIFFNTNCVQNKPFVTTAAFENTPPPSLMSVNTSDPSNIDLSLKKPKKSFFKKKSTWIVIGTSILATSAVIMMNEQNNKSKSFKPVHTVSSQ